VTLTLLFAFCCRKIFIVFVQNICFWYLYGVSKIYVEYAIFIGSLQPHVSQYLSFFIDTFQNFDNKTGVKQYHMSTVVWNWWLITRKNTSKVSRIIWMLPYNTLLKHNAFLTWTSSLLILIFSHLSFYYFLLLLDLIQCELVITSKSQSYRSFKIIKSLIHFLMLH